MSKFLDDLNTSCELREKMVSFRQKKVDEATRELNQAQQLANQMKGVRNFVESLDKNLIYMPMAWVKDYTKCLWFLGDLMKAKAYNFEWIIKGNCLGDYKHPSIKLCILKTEYAKEHNLMRKNAYEYCPKEITLEFTSYFTTKFASEMININTWNRIVTAAEDYSGDKNIFIGVWLYCYYVARTSPMFTASYNDIAKSTGFSLTTIKKVLEHLEKIKVIKKLRTGSVFTTGSCYKYLEN